MSRWERWADRLATSEGLAIVKGVLGGLILASPFVYLMIRIST